MCSTGRFVGTVVVIDMYELLYCVLVVDCEVGDVVKEVVWFAAAIWLLLILLKKKKLWHNLNEGCKKTSSFV